MAIASLTLVLSAGCAGRSGDTPEAAGGPGGTTNESAAENGGALPGAVPPADNGGTAARPNDPDDKPALGAGGVTASPELCEQFLEASSAGAPSVLVLADRSASMFDPLPSGVSGPWYELRTAALAVVQALAPEVRFGFAAFAGSPVTCPALESVAFGLNNYAAIEDMYGVLQRSPDLSDSGTLGALQSAEALLADAPGDKFIWLLTDGDTDYCNDGPPLCPADSVIGELQALAGAASPIRTLVSGIPSLVTTVPNALQAFADAGMGQPVEFPATVVGPPDLNVIFDQCSSTFGWPEHFATTGKPSTRGQTIGNYSASSGGTPVYSPLEQDSDTLIQQIRSVVLGDRPCAFDLARAGVTSSALATLDESARIEVDGAVIPYDVENGWHRVGASGVALEGEACASVRAAAAPPAIQLFWSCEP